MTAGWTKNSTALLPMMKRNGLVVAILSLISGLSGQHLGEDTYSLYEAAMIVFWAEEANRENKIVAKTKIELTSCLTLGRFAEITSCHYIFARSCLLLRGRQRITMQVKGMELDGINKEPASLSWNLQSTLNKSFPRICLFRSSSNPRVQHCTMEDFKWTGTTIMCTMALVSGEIVLILAVPSTSAEFRANPPSGFGHAGTDKVIVGSDSRFRTSHDPNHPNYARMCLGRG